MWFFTNINIGIIGTAMAAAEFIYVYNLYAWSAKQIADNEIEFKSHQHLLAERDAEEMAAAHVALLQQIQVAHDASLQQIKVAHDAEMACILSPVTLSDIAQFARSQKNDYYNACVAHGVHPVGDVETVTFNTSEAAEKEYVDAFPDRRHTRCVLA